MNARATMTLNAPVRLEPVQAPRSWFAAAFDWSVLTRMWGAQPGEADRLPRRRRDRHPDAPLPRPLLASRDLPPADAGHGPGPIIAPVAAPRSPAPMSDAQIAQLMAAATARPVAIAMTPHGAAAPSSPARAPVECGARLSRDGADRPAEPRASAVAAPCPPAIVAAVPDQLDMDVAAVEAALAKALATLRKLAEQTQPNRRR